MGVSLNKNCVGTTIKEYLLMALGMFLYSFGFICCILPASTAAGGASGLSYVLVHLMNHALTVGEMVLIINAVLLVIAGFVVGWNFGIKTIYCVVVMSIVMHFLEEWFMVGEHTGWVAKIVLERDGITDTTNIKFVDLFNLQNRLLSSILDRKSVV